MSRDEKENNLYENYQSRLVIEVLYIIDISTALLWYIWLWTLGSFLVLKNIKRDVQKCNLHSFSILYNALIKYPLLGFEPSQFFEYKLYKNSYKEYMTIYDTLVKIREINKKDPYKPYLLDNKLSFKMHINDRVRFPKLIAYYNHRNKKIKFYDKPSNNKVVIKNLLGGGGVGVWIASADNYIDILKKNRFKSKIAEEFIMQHNFLNEIFNGSVNTVRCITVQNNESIYLLNTTLKVGVKKSKGKDNVHFGGFCIEIDMETGKLGIGRPFYPENIEYKCHPETKFKFYGKTLPYYNELKQIAIDAHKCFPMYTIIGWDIAISETGPVVIEGNRVPYFKLGEIHEPLKKKILPFIKKNN